jgi:hypothetical protein
MMITCLLSLAFNLCRAGVREGEIPNYPSCLWDEKVRKAAPSAR